MDNESELKRSSEAGKAAFAAGRYQSAAELFRAAASGYAALDHEIDAAEQKNNLSVTLLKLGRAQDALESTLGTDEIFAAQNDRRRQGIAVNNKAAALESLHRLDEALAGYERAAELLGEAGERELRSLALKAAAAIQLRRGKVAESGLRMIGVMEAREHPSLLERALKFLVHLVQR